MGTGCHPRRLRQGDTPKSPSMPPSARTGEQNRKEKEEEAEAEEPEDRGGRRRFGWMEEKVLERSWSTEDKAEHTPSPSHTPPFKAGVHSRKATRGNGIGQSCARPPVLEGSPQGFYSCFSVSPSGTEEGGPSDPLRQPGTTLTTTMVAQATSMSRPDCAIHLPLPLLLSLPSCSLLYVGARAILLECKLSHVTPLLRPSNGFPLHQSKTFYLN